MCVHNYIHTKRAAHQQLCSQTVFEIRRGVGHSSQKKTCVLVNSDSILADIMVRSPRKLFIFIIYDHFFGSKYPKTIWYTFENGSTLGKAFGKVDPTNSDVLTCIERDLTSVCVPIQCIGQVTPKLIIFIINIQHRILASQNSLSNRSREQNHRTWPDHLIACCFVDAVVMLPSSLRTFPTMLKNNFEKTNGANHS